MLTYNQLYYELSKSLLKNQFNIKLANLDPTIHSSVLVIIHFSYNIPTILFTKRSRYLKRHAGEISFPGGKFSLSDKSILDTAIRETFEEIGVNIDKKKIIGSLNPTYTFTSKMLIYPFVALVKKIPYYFKPSFEVEKIVNIPIDILMKSFQEDLEHSLMDLKMFKFEIDGDIIWGATARILKDLIDKI